MPNEPDIEALKAELADKKAMLANLESGKLHLGRPFENREVGLRRRIVELEKLVGGRDTTRT